MYLEELYGHIMPLELDTLKEEDLNQFKILSDLFETEEKYINIIIETVEEFEDIVDSVTHPFDSNDIEDLKEYVSEMIDAIHNNVQIKTGVDSLYNKQAAKYLTLLLQVYKKINNIILNL